MLGISHACINDGMISRRKGKGNAKYSFRVS